MKYFDKALESIIESVKINSVETDGREGAPFGDEVASALEHALDTAEELGFVSNNLDGFCGTSDIGEGEMFGILGHVDIVPIGEGWTRGQGEIADNVLYGRGVLDDKGPMYLCLYAVAELIKDGFKPTKTIRFIWGADEESGWKCIEHYNEVEKMPDVGFSPDADFPVIFAEKGIVHYDMVIDKSDSVYEFCGGERVNMVPNWAMAKIKLTKKALNVIEAHKNLLSKIEVDEGNKVITIYTKGKSAHGSTPQKGVNAIIKLVTVVSGIDKNLVPVALKLNDYYGKNCKMNLSDEQSGRLTVNVGTAKIRDGQIILELDIRYPISYVEYDIYKILTKGFRACGFYKTMNHDSLYCDKNNSLVQKLMNAYNKVTGENAQPISIGGGTYARALPLGVAFGPILIGRESTIHEADECSPIDDLKLAYEIYKEGIRSLCF